MCDYGGYDCQCPAGYERENIFEGFTLVRVNCIGENECEVMNFCHHYANCVNTGGSYTCECKTGFQGDGWLLLPSGDIATGCVDINECNESPCDANAQCANSIGSYTCTCCNGYSGDGHTCEDINECNAAMSGRKRRDIEGNFIPTESCHADAHCINQDGTFDCEYNFGYFGDGFEYAHIDECVESGHNCDSNAACTNTIGGWTCACNT